MKKIRYVTAALLALACHAREPVYAQVDFFSLEAAYIYNFTAFADWPAPRLHPSQLYVCVSPGHELAAMLAKLEGRAVASRNWHVHPLHESGDASVCDVLVIDAATTASPSVKAALSSDWPLLIVRTADAAAGPYVILLVLQGDQLRFDIDHSEATRRHLGLSSKLLRLARKVT